MNKGQKSAAQTWGVKGGLCWGADNLSTEGTQDINLLLAHLLGHHNDAPVALDSSSKRKPNAFAPQRKVFFFWGGGQNKGQDTAHNTYTHTSVRNRHCVGQTAAPFRPASQPASSKASKASKQTCVAGGGLDDG